ncbi:MAG: glucose-1-phosphate thymidylyltransferase [Thermoleophilia bacterium]
MELRGLILAGGAGTRLRPITHTSAKQLVPVANKPVLFYALEAFAEAGIREVAVIVSPESHDEIAAAAGDGSRFGLSLAYVVQDAPRGLAHAVLTAEEALGSSAFVMYLGDNLLRDGISSLVERFRSAEPDALILLQHVPNPSQYGVAELDGDRVVQLTEKPPQPRSDLALVGVYMFTPAIFDSCRAIAPSARGELEITDAIQQLIDRGLRVEPHVVTGWWKDTGQWEDMLEANRLVLDALQPDEIAGTLDDTRLEGRVEVGEGAVLERCHVRGPVVIGPGATIRDAYIGPYTAIGAGCEIDHAEIEHSILLEGAKVLHLDARMEGSLIGRDTVIERSDARPRAHRFLVGDSSRIRIL